MSDLAEFLLARIAEDEAAAKDDRKRDAAHIVRWQPARVLAECEAKRRIIEELGPPHFLTGGSSAAYRTVLRLLALPYSGHLDYRPEWRAE